MHNGRRRLPAEQASHNMRKRLSFSGWPAADKPVYPDPDPAPAAVPPVRRQVVTLTGPGFTTTLSGAVQVTQNLPVPPSTDSTTQTTPLTTPIATPSPPPPPSLPPPSAPPASTPLGASSPLQPSASAINPTNGSSEGVNTAPVSGVSSSNPAGLPTGAIVGIALACVLLVLGAFVFLMRQRAVQQRKLRRATTPWLAQGAAGFAQPAPQPAGAFAGAVPAGYAPERDMGEASQSPGVSFARAQAAALASRPASMYSPGPGPVAVPMPPPSSYGNAPLAAPIAAGGAPATVRYEFIPSLPDELSIVSGDVVRIFSEYDDGWALCANARGEQGMVPLECLDRRGALAPPAPGDTNRNSHRTSSLGVRY